MDATEISLAQEVAERTAESVERAQVEAELRLSAERLRLATTAAKGMGVFDWHVKSDLFFGDEAFLKIFGLGSEDARQAVITLEQVVLRVHPVDRPGVEAAIADAMRSGHDYVKEYRVASEDGFRWVSARGCCMLDEQGQPERFPGVVIDITERTQVEDDLRTSEANLSLAVDTARLGVWSLDVDTNILKASVICKENFGYSSTADFTYQHWLSATHPDDMAGVHAGLLNIVQNETEYRQERRIVWPDGSPHWLLSSARLLSQKPGQPLTILGVNLNITDRKLAEGALIQNEKLAAVGRLASSIAHEINNPLESVTNLVYLAKSAGDRDELREYLDAADAELRRVSAITSHTLRFHKQATNPVEVSSEELIEGVLAIHMGRLKNARIAVERRTQAPCSVSCFDGEIRQVLGNLIGNAIDAMSLKGGRLLIRSRKGAIGKVVARGVTLTIADTGPGMPADVVQKIFEAFFTTKGISGTGLGLWISKEIVEHHYGRLTVRSSQISSGSGTVFTLFLPSNATLR